MKSLFSFILAARLYLLAAPFLITYTGDTMNQAVLISNGGKFPVMLNERVSESRIFGGLDKMGFLDSIHCKMTRKTHLNWLADYINLQTSILSPGDILIYLGEYLSKMLPVIWATLILAEKKTEFNLCYA